MPVGGLWDEIFSGHGSQGLETDFTGTVSRRLIYHVYIKGKIMYT